MRTESRFSKRAAMFTMTSLFLFAGVHEITGAPPGRGSQGDPCAATDALQQSAARVRQLQVFEAFRDTTLKSNAKGRSLISLYETHTRRVVTLFARDPALREKGGEFLMLLAPVLGDLVNGSGSQKITPKLASSGSRFFEHLVKADRKHKGGELAKAVEFELKEFPPSSAVGMPVAQAWERLSHTQIQQPGGSPETRTIPGLSIQAGNEKTPCPTIGEEIARDRVESVPYYQAVSLALLDKRCSDAFPGLKLQSIKTVRCAPDPRGPGFGPNATADLTCSP
jgi:hypothetical protein